MMVLETQPEPHEVSTRTAAETGEIKETFGPVEMGRLGESKAVAIGEENPGQHVLRDHEDSDRTHDACSKDNLPEPNKDWEGMTAEDIPWSRIWCVLLCVASDSIALGSPLPYLPQFCRLQVRNRWYLSSSGRPNDSFFVMWCIF